MAKNFKTNVMRILDKAGIEYNVFQYPHGKEAVEGSEVASLMGQNPEQVFKTLVAKGKTGEFYVFDVPVDSQLDLKKGAKAVGEKSIEMTHVKDLVKICGYARGNVSPLGMKSSFKTVFNITALDFETIYISAGKIGFQVEVNSRKIIDFIGAEALDIIK